MADWNRRFMEKKPFRLSSWQLAKRLAQIGSGSR
jgi:hypothetical protein